MDRLERVTNKLLKLSAILCVLVTVLAIASFLEYLTGVSKEFWWETVCLIHISTTIANKVTKEKSE